MNTKLATSRMRTGQWADIIEYSGAAEPLFRKSENRLSGIGNRRIA